MVKCPFIGNELLPLPPNRGRVCAASVEAVGSGSRPTLCRHCSRLSQRSPRWSLPRWNAAAPLLRITFWSSANRICDGSWPVSAALRARARRWAGTHRYDEPSTDPGPSSPRRRYPL